MLFKLLSISFLLSLSIYCKGQVITSLQPGEFEHGITRFDSVQLLDVRTMQEYQSGHLKHALLADWQDKNEFDRRISFLDKKKPVYVYCLGGSRSAAAADKMRAIGYQQVYELKGGINAWRADNRHVEGRKDQKQMSLSDLDAAIKRDRVVLVDFGADWCPPCKKMEPVLNRLQANNPGKFKLVKVDGGRDLDLLSKYNVTELPVFLIFKNGKQVWRKTGLVEEKELSELLR